MKGLYMDKHTYLMMVSKWTDRKHRKRMILGVALFLAAISFLILYQGVIGGKNHIVSWYEADIDQDGQKELLVIRGGEKGKVLETGELYGDFLEVYEEYDIRGQMPSFEGKATYQFDFSSVKPSKVMAGDIDGDGIQEIGICVYKTTKFHPVLAKRPFFYRLTDGQLEPVWLGSRLARPFLDYIVWDVDQDGMEEIVSIEKTKYGDSLVAMYDWKGFGFELKAISKELTGETVFYKQKDTEIEQIQICNQKICYQVRLSGSTVELIGS